MSFKLFYVDFPKIAEKSTKSVLVPEGDYLPPGKYGFLESYCTDKRCDCRRVLINVVTTSASEPLAVISFGWEPKSFYKSWFEKFDEDSLKIFKGPALDSFQKQSIYAEPLLEIFKEILADPQYISRLIHHYVMVKSKQGMRLPKDLLPKLQSMAPCGCESGMAFRFCCGKR